MKNNKLQKKLEKYIQLEKNRYFKDEAVKLLIENNKIEIYNRFYKELEFGTAGMRGIIGAGTYYINTYNVAKASQGIANYILKIIQNPKVVISYDSRHFSKEFAYDAAEIFASNGLKVYIYKHLRPTPQLSYTVRKLECDLGIMITASHNTKKYNGYKVYWKGGVQVISPHDTRIISEIQKVSNITKTLTKEEGINKQVIIEINDEIDMTYVDKINEEFPDFNKKSKNVNLKVAYTPLHGTGGTIIKILFKGSKVELITEPSQINPDPEFPTVNYPNPEEHVTMARVIELAKRENCDIAFATDPDADRVGIAFNESKEWKILNGNQIASILMNYLLSRENDPKKVFVIASFVTTPMLDKIAQKYNSTLLRTYTGFKWIGHLIDEIKLKEPNKKFIFGCEESHGYLIGTGTRDKDAFSAIKGFCDLMLTLKKNQITIGEYLQEMYKEFGYYEDFTINKSFKGSNWYSLREELMSKFRNEVKKEFAGINIIKKIDYKTLKETDMNNNIYEIKEYKYTTNAIRFLLENEIQITIRPSGTEPKIKFYVSIYSRYEQKNNISDIMNNIKMEIEKY
ncbi:phospho-sugar mutase [Borrelia anserina]|uniref:Phosphoglucomutase n=2 Tax=Borrelia anserina TaxID=143 RepID=W5SNP5_BORAN|nr:phospho-sugar mutase [Borrelia anserina]AHH08809.1 Phosphoglucomutase [Borrelia anserina BA2]APR65251.1 phosphomannomutase [Borrelia anserina Es]UPA07178.1 phospho-sugar mutase [Borrelia anserina]